MSEPSLPRDQRTMTTNEPLGSKVEPIPGMEVCDFCTGTPIVVRYPCGLVVIDTPMGTHVSSDSWGACAECHVLVDAGESEPLVIRALRGFVEQEGEQDPEVMALLAGMFAGVHRSFFAARLGDAQPL